MVGQEFVDGWQLLHLLRTSRTCQIWEAVERAGEARVALKMLLPQFTDDREQVALLKHEAAVGQTLNHPHVLETHDFASSGKHAYLVMELFKHPNLKQWIQANEDGANQHIAQISTQAAEGLAHFHEQGWVHRDVKPDNYLVADEGDKPNVKLIDFALALKPKGVIGRLLQGKGKIQGTRSYMAPEQIRGEHVDARTDIYSFGCLLFEILTGKTPYAGDSSQDLLNKHLRAAIPSIQAANITVSDEAATLVRNTLAKKADDRPQSMREVALTLRATPLFR